ncbi:MAG: cytoplasmic protein [Verrucomicrobiae bacterium]|nr:cytoplasmic protein [Verrucomicrobiae bacterium]
MSQMNLDDVRLDKDNLYREETYTDLKIGSLHKLIPIKLDGSADASREAVFTARTQIMSPAGPLPVQAELEAHTIEAAIEEFPAAIRDAVEEMVQQAQQMQQNQRPGADGPVIL